MFMCIFKLMTLAALALSIETVNHVFDYKVVCCDQAQFLSFLAYYLGFVFPNYYIFVEASNIQLESLHIDLLRLRALSVVAVSRVYLTSHFGRENSVGLFILKSPS